MSMPLKLARPLAFFDIESTGLNVEDDRIVEIGVVKLMPDGERQSRARRINPGRPIPASSTAIHGITDADVADCPRFAQVASSLHDWLSGCDFGGFNLESFDMKMLANEFRRCGLEFPAAGTLVVDPKVIFHQREQRDLSAAVRFYCGRTLENAHSAMADVEATIDVLFAQLERYDDLPRDVPGLHAATHQKPANWVDAQGRLRWLDDGRASVGFGVNVGRALEDLAKSDPSFLSWMLRKDFSLEVKEAVEATLRGEPPRRPAPAA